MKKTRSHNVKYIIKNYEQTAHNYHNCMGWQKITKKKRQGARFSWKLSTISSWKKIPYLNLNNFLLYFLKTCRERTSKLWALKLDKKLETLELGAIHQIESLDVKSLCINVSVSEAIKIALLGLYSSDIPPDYERSTLNLLLKRLVTIVYFKSNGNWYCQKMVWQWGLPWQ